MLLYFINHRGTMDFYDVVYTVFAYGVILLLSLPVHELAHGLVAHWCGDDTAKWHGRLSLNPFRHLDLWGTLMIMAVGIGYAKPVPINPHNFRNYKRDTILVSLAGPLSNFIMAYLAVFIYRLCAYCGLFMYEGVADALWLLMNIIASVNVTLMVFNLLPVPPLDGSRLWTTLLPGRWAYTLERYSRYITMGLFVLLMTNVLDAPLYFMQSGVLSAIDWLTGLPFQLLDLIL